MGGILPLIAVEGLDRAEKWVSVAGVFLSVALSAAGLALGWRTWRQSRPAAPSRQVTASGSGSVAVGGDNDGSIGTTVSGPPPLDAETSKHDGVLASGDGAVAVGCNNRESIRTSVKRDTSA